jgi:tRNA1(Val) A37 N6-methylase TrmN6
MKTPLQIDNFLLELIAKQGELENQIEKDTKNRVGAFYTHKISTIDNIIAIVAINNNLFDKKILEPSCGQGILLLRLLVKVYQQFPSPEVIVNFIENNLIFVDINPQMVSLTQLNLQNLYQFLFEENYQGHFNGFEFDFTKKLSYSGGSLFGNSCPPHALSRFLGKIDYVIGNPPYVTLYGRRDKKQSEAQRIYYLEHYQQFPSCLKNGKINYIMLFLENSLDFLKAGGLLSFIIDVSFFETAYLYTRKYLLEHTNLLSIDYNLADFEVASGQLILKLMKGNLNPNNQVRLYNAETKEIQYVNQTQWFNPKDEYKFRINSSLMAERIIQKICTKSPLTLKELFPHKSLRTCTMLLDMEDLFTVSHNQSRNDLQGYPYYQGSKSLKAKFGELQFTKYFYYDKELQDSINDQLKIELTIKGIKNKKRIGLGEKTAYDNPKVYIRQSAMELIATYDEKRSAANNSLYLFTLKNSDVEAKNFLKFMCGWLNSDLLTYYAQNQNIIRNAKGKQPQIKIADLYNIRIPADKIFQNTLAQWVSEIYQDKRRQEIIIANINELVYDYYELSGEEISHIRKSLKDS